MEYISERITNIEDLELLIRQARVGAELLVQRVKMENPPMDEIGELSGKVLDLLTGAENFEFQIDRRKVNGVD